MKKFFKSTPIDIMLINDSELKIVWKDKHESRYDSFFLRKMSPDVESRGGHGGKIGNNTQHLEPPITILKYDQVGRYALQFQFSDGHSLGIFSFEYLRELDEDS